MVSPIFRGTTDGQNDCPDELLNLIEGVLVQLMVPLLMKLAMKFLCQRMEQSTAPPFVSPSSQGGSQRPKG